MSIRHLCRSLRGLNISAASAPGAIAPPPRSIQIPDVEVDQQPARILPSAPSLVKVYTFPTPNKYARDLPTMKTLILEKSDPINVDLKIEDPATQKAPMIAGPRMLTIRRRKMKKHKRRKRYFRDFFKYQTHHRKKKAKAEALFRRRMQDMINELEEFDPIAHVKDTISRAKREWSTQLAPTGRKKYPHWSQLLALEELYGLPKITHIDKKAGTPTPEDAQKIAQLRNEYFKKYTRKPRKSTPNLEAKANSD